MKWLISNFPDILRAETSEIEKKNYGAPWLKDGIYAVTNTGEEILM